MSIKVSYRYQLSAQIKSIAVYYFVIFCVAVLMISTFAINYTTSYGEVFNGQFNGLEFATMIYIFIAGCNSFKEEFGMLMQNGVSRKSLFTGRLLTSLSIAFGMAVIDKMIYFIWKAIIALSNDKLSFSSFFEMLYYDGHTRADSINVQILSFIFNMFIYLFVTAVGYIITIIYYRLGKNGKVALSVSIPVGLFVILPSFDYSVTNGRIIGGIFHALDSAFGVSAQKPVYGIITCILGSILLSALSWLLIRRAYVKE